MNTITRLIINIVCFYGIFYISFKAVHFAVTKWGMAYLIIPTAILINFILVMIMIGVWIDS